MVGSQGRVSWCEVAREEGRVEMPVLRIQRVKVTPQMLAKGPREPRGRSLVLRALPGGEGGQEGGCSQLEGWLGQGGGLS